MKELLTAFGNRLKYLRKEVRMTQEELAKELELHNSYIGLLERGDRIPSLITLMKIASYFGVKPADLISEALNNDLLHFKQKELIYLIHNSSPEDISRLHQVAKVIVREDNNSGRRKTG